MKFSAGKYCQPAGAILLGFTTPSVAGQTMTAQLIKDATVVDIPFVVGDIDSGERSDTLWVRGDKPENSLLARFSIRSVQAASLVDPSGQSSGILWRAFPGGGITLLRVRTR